MKNRRQDWWTVEATNLEHESERKWRCEYFVGFSFVRWMLGLCIMTELMCIHRTGNWKWTTYWIEHDIPLYPFGLQHIFNVSF